MTFANPLFVAALSLTGVLALRPDPPGQGRRDARFIDRELADHAVRRRIGVGLLYWGAAFVLAMFSTGGELNPPVRVKLVWSVILGALGLVMILSGSIEAVNAIIALGVFVFVGLMFWLYRKAVPEDQSADTTGMEVNDRDP